MGWSCLGSYRKTFRASYRLTMPRITPLHWKKLERVFSLPAFMDVDVLDDDFLLSGLAFKPG